MKGWNVLGAMLWSGGRMNPSAASQHEMPRVLAMTVRTRRMELEKKNKWRPTQRVWLSRYGEPLDSLIAWFKLVMQEARARNPLLKDVTWHIFRHTYISRLVMAGVDIRTVQELAGHKSISMTIRYSHLSPDHKLSAVAKHAAFRKRNSAT